MVLEGNTTGKNTTEDVIKILKSTTHTQSKKNKIKRIYEDDNFIIDLISADTPTVRVSIFKNNHFQDEVFIRKDDYLS